MVKRGKLPASPDMPATEAFYATPTWHRLERILAGNGGAYGLYGPRGSGKSWLMLRAIKHAESEAGMGLMFSSPAEYETVAFLSALCDNLASAVEKRFIRDNIWALAARRLRSPLTAVAAALAAAAVVTYSIGALAGKDSHAQTPDSSIPVALWIAAGVTIGMLLVLLVGRAVWEGRPSGRLVRDATALRERIRFSAALKRATETGVTGGSGLTGGWKSSDERSLDERPTTAASLVFDFRNLAELIVANVKGPLVIGIDELDKYDDPGKARLVLRDIKGIFEITRVYFLVSVAEEAASALRLGSVRDAGRNEFDSYFYTVLELPPLWPADVAALLERRHARMGARYEGLICLLGAGNCRETLRLAERLTAAAGKSEPDSDLPLLRILEAEAVALLREIIAVYAANGDADTVIAGTWRVLSPGASFSELDAFTDLASSAIHDYWQPGWADATWNERVREPWRRFLIRLFVAGIVVAIEIGTNTARAFEPMEIADLREVLIMSARSSSTAKLMLESRCGPDLAGRYTLPSDMRLLPDTAG
jgi:hypothetical protein